MYTGIAEINGEKLYWRRYGYCEQDGKVSFIWDISDSQTSSCFNRITAGCDKITLRGAIDIFLKYHSRKDRITWYLKAIKEINNSNIPNKEFSINEINQQLHENYNIHL